MANQQTNSEHTSAMGQPIAVPGQPMMASGEQVNASGQQMMAPGQPMHTSGQPVMSFGEPMNTPGQQLMEHSQRMEVVRQLMNANGQQMDASGQPMMASGEQINALGQPMNTPGQQLMEHSQQMNVALQLMNAYGQQMMAPGQPMHTSGQQMMASGRPMLGPGQYGYNVDVLGQQPGMEMLQMMPPPSAIPGCPPGLEYLVQLDQLLVHQKVEFPGMAGETVTRTQPRLEKKYVIKNSQGQQVYFATEQSDEWQRLCYGPARAFIFTITDNMGQEVMRIIRHFKRCARAGWNWCSCSSSYCSYFIEIESPPGTVIGYIRQTASFASPYFDVKDANNECVLKIRGPYCRCQNGGRSDDIEFTVFSKDMADKIGKVSKQWVDYLHEILGGNFEVQFPADLDVEIKALLLASTFLIHFMFFELDENYNCHHR